MVDHFQTSTQNEYLTNGAQRMNQIITDWPDFLTASMAQKKLNVDKDTFKKVFAPLLREVRLNGEKSTPKYYIKDISLCIMSTNIFSDFILKTVSTYSM